MSVTARRRLLLSGLAWLVASLPLLIAWRATPVGSRFMGAVFNTGDVSAYLAGIRQGAAGALRYTIPFTPEPVAPQVMYTLYLALGHWLAAVGGSLMLWWHVARLGAAAIALLCLALLIDSLAPARPRWQRMATFLVLFGGGLGWLFRLLSRRLPLPASWWPDVALAEWSPVLIIANPPHFALGLGLLALLMTAVVRLEKVPAGVRWSLTAALAAAGLGLVYPYAIPLAGAVIGIYLAGEALVRRRLWTSQVGALIPAGLIVLTFAFYYGRWLPSDPLWTVLNVTQNGVPPPSLIGVVIGLGGLGVLATIGVRPWLKRGGSRLLPVWAFVQLLMLGAPLPYAGRFAFGITVPFALLAATGIEARFHRVRWRIPALLALTLSLALGLVVETRTAVRTAGWPFYASDEEWAAMVWLAEQTADDDVILAYHQVGNWLPRLAPGRLFVGQKFATIEPDAKAALVVSFWQEEAPAGWREALIETWGIEWIYYGHFEREITNGVVRPPGQRVYSRNGVEIYHVAP